MSIYLLVLIIFIVGLIVGFQLRPIFTSEKTITNKRDLDYYKNTYLSKQGHTFFHGDEKGINYNLKSFDSGKNWYVVEYNFDSKELKVLGDVKDIYPGLMDNLNTWEELRKHVQENGSIENSELITEEAEKI